MPINRSSYLFVVAFLVVSRMALGGTFSGQSTATFVVTEKIDGTTTTASKSGPINIILDTDYSTMRWTLSFNVDLLMSGAPTQSFETRLLANASLTSQRCNASSCDFTANVGSPLSFPDANGQSGAGSYALYGTAGWTLTDRIVSSIRQRTSPQKAVLGSGFYAGGNAANTTGNHYLSVANYPSTVVLTPGSSIASAWLDPTGGWSSNVSRTLHLGRYKDPSNSSNYVEVTIPSLPTTISLIETLAGDFNSSSIVDAGDYVTWRKGSGLLSPFLTNYSVWRSNFGNQIALPTSSELIAAVPEPTSLLMLVTGAAVIWFHSRRGQRRFSSYPTAAGSMLPQGSPRADKLLAAFTAAMPSCKLALVAGEAEYNAAGVLLAGEVLELVAAREPTLNAFEEQLWDLAEGDWRNGHGDMLIAAEMKRNHPAPVLATVAYSAAFTSSRYYCQTFELKARSSKCRYCFERPYRGTRTRSARVSG